MRYVIRTCSQRRLLLRILQKLKKSQLIGRMHVSRVTSVYFQDLMMKQLIYKYYNKQITIRHNGDVQLNNPVEKSSGAYRLANDNTMKTFIQ